MEKIIPLETLKKGEWLYPWQRHAEIEGKPPLVKSMDCDLVSIMSV
jgi:hypothetical protein